MTLQLLTYDETKPRVCWNAAVNALREGHIRPRAQVSDMFLGAAEATLLSRGAAISGVGFGVKSVTVFDKNRQNGLPTVQGAMLVFDPENGCLEAVIEGRLVTEIKTAADSVLGACYLARPDSRHLVIVGGGTVARSLIDAYSAVFPTLEQISIWTRRPEQARALAADYTAFPVRVMAADDLAKVAGQADIISSATMARDPVLRGAWIKPGTHVDLIGAYKTDMREADDALIAGASLFADSRDTTVHHIGEFAIPIKNNVITPGSIIGDLYDLVPNPDFYRRSPEEVTLFKNGGGAHLDLMIARYLCRL